METEEKYPLLLVYLDDGTIRHTSKDHHYPRGQNIATGAATVITTWPGHVTSCWTSALLCGIIFLLFSSMTLSFLRQPYFMNMATQKEFICQTEKPKSEQTLYFAHTTNNWSYQEVRTLQILLQHYYDLNIVLLNVQNCQNSSKDTDSKVFNGTRVNNTKIRDKVNVADGKFNKLTKKYKQMKIINYSCSDYFKNTPLKNCWTHFTEDILNFAVRILELWENGGMSFNLKSPIFNFSYSEQDVNSFVLKNKGVSEVPTTVHTNIINKNETNSTNSSHNISRKERTTTTISPIKIRKTLFRIVILPSIENIPENSITSDFQGNFIATHTQCHAFFEQILKSLRNNCHDRTITVEKLIIDAILKFCKIGEVDRRYCDKAAKYNTTHS